MLKIWFGKMSDNPNYVYSTSLYFNYNYEDAWITSDFGRAVIKDIDRSDVVAEGVINSPVLGHIPPEKYLGAQRQCFLCSLTRKEKYSMLQHVETTARSGFRR